MSADGYLEAEIASRVKPIADAGGGVLQENINRCRAVARGDLAERLPAISRTSGASEARGEVIEALRKQRPSDSCVARGARVNLAVAASNPTLGAASTRLR